MKMSSSWELNGKSKLRLFVDEESGKVTINVIYFLNTIHLNVALLFECFEFLEPLKVIVIVNL